jgi:hypothetical protein
MGYDGKSVFFAVSHTVVVYVFVVAWLWRRWFIWINAPCGIGGHFIAVSYVFASKFFILQYYWAGPYS